MKKIILILLLVTYAGYGQTTIIKDSISYHWQQILYHAARLGTLEGIDQSSLISRVEALERNSESNGSNIQALFDSIASHNLQLTELRNGGGYVADPFAPSITATADNDSAKLIIVKTNPAVGTTPDSFRVYLSTDNITFNWIGSFAYALGSYRTPVYNTSTIYYVKLKSLVIATPIALSEFSNTAYDTTYTPVIDPPAASGVWTFDITISTDGAGDTYTLAEAKGILGKTSPNGTIIDTIKVNDGLYNAQGSFAAGTSANPYCWVGEIGTDKTKDSTSSSGTQSAVFYSNSSSNPGISSGAYNEFYGIIFQQNYSARQLLSVSNYVVLDSCSVKYPSNANSSSNHTVVVTGNNVIFRDTDFRNGSKCIIWVRKNSGTQGDNFLMEGCTIANATNHPPIQIMPETNSTDTTTIKRPIVRNCLFIDNPYGDGIYSRYCEQFAFYNNIFIRSDGPYNIDIHTGFHYPTGTPEDTCNSKGGIVAYNTIIVDGQCNIIFNKGSNQTKFVNNVIYSTDPAPDMIFRLDGAWNAIYRHDFNYNLYDYAENLASGNTVRGTWGSANTSVWYYQWEGVTGHESNTTIDVTPTFNNTNAVGGYRPPNISAPQTAKGIPVTTANGFFMNITTDYYGNTRNAINPTIGHSNYIGE